MTTTQEMAALLTSLYDSFGSGNASVWFASLAPDAVVVGTDEAEWCAGRDAAVAVLSSQITEMSGTGLSVTAGQPHIVADGNWVWAADRPLVHLTDGTDLTARFTVLAKHDGTRLVIQHTHLSVGAPNEDTINQRLTV